MKNCSTCVWSKRKGSKKKWVGYVCQKFFHDWYFEINNILYKKSVSCADWLGSKTVKHFIEKSEGKRKIDKFPRWNTLKENK